MFVVKLFVAVLFVEIQCLECSAYKNEQSCNFKGTLPCKWNDSVTSGSKCKNFICSQATTQTDCENNGVESCFWNTSTSKCQIPACVYFPLADCVTLGTSFGLDCYLSGSGSYCQEKGCTFYDTQTGCETDSAAAGFKCYWGGSFCSDRSCFNKDGVATKEECESYDIASGGSCKYTAAVGATPSDCAPASCSDWSAEGDAACVANNGKLECVWNASASANYKCTEKACGYFKSESDCDANAAKYSCSWYSSILYGSGCWSLTCGDLDDSKQTCEDNHPACHYSGSCKEGGDAASVVGVSGTLSMLILLLLAFNFF